MEEVMSLPNTPKKQTKSIGRTGLIMSSQACDSCKVNHRKCDGSPGVSCKRCVQRNETCVFSIDTRKNRKRLTVKKESIVSKKQTHIDYSSLEECMKELNAKQQDADYWKTKFLQLRQGLSKSPGRNELTVRPITLSQQTQV